MIFSFPENGFGALPTGGIPDRRVLPDWAGRNLLPWHLLALLDIHTENRFSPSIADLDF
jgi:hypothetical protein